MTGMLCENFCPLASIVIVLFPPFYVGVRLRDYAVDFSPIADQCCENDLNLISNKWIQGEFPFFLNVAFNGGSIGW